MKIKCSLISGITLSFLCNSFAQISAPDKVIKFIEESNCQAALDMYSTSSGRGETLHQVIIPLGKCLLGAEEYEKAIDIFKDGRDEFENLAEFHYLFGQAYLGKLNNTGNFIEKGVWASKTKKEFQSCVDLDPDHLDARNSLAQYYLNAPAIAGGSKKKAQEQIDEIIKRDPKMGYLIQANLYTQQKKYDQAEEQYFNYLEISGDTAEVYYQLGFMYQTQEDYTRAFEAFQISISSSSLNNKSYYQFGRTAVFSRQNLDKGIQFLKHYIRFPAVDGPAKPFAYWRLGMLYELTGNKDLAVASYKKALVLDPGNQEAAKALKDIQ